MDAFTGFVFFMILVMLYFLPAIAAKSRGHSSTGGIFVVNLFLGWTLIGWVVALAWAYSGRPASAR